MTRIPISQQRYAKKPSKDECALIQGGNTHLDLSMPTSFIILSATADSTQISRAPVGQGFSLSSRKRLGESEENTGSY